MNQTVFRLSCLLTSALALAPAARGENAQRSPAERVIRTIITQACLDCHDDKTAEGGLNLARLPLTIRNRTTRRQWIDVHDRIAAGEMPPDAGSLPDEKRSKILHHLAAAIHTADYAEVAREGRGPMRRLTQLEYEQNLRSLLQLPFLDIRDVLPADRERHHSNRVADVLDVSRVQLAATLTAADQALREAVASGVQPRKAVQYKFPATRMFQEAQTFGGREAMFYAKNAQLVTLSGADLTRIRTQGKHDPQVELAIFRSASWPYYGYPEGFQARQPGAYRIRFSARAVRQVRDFRLLPAQGPIPMTFRARRRSGPDVSGDVRATGGLLDILPETGIYETTIRLKKEETFEYSLLGLPVPRAINPDDGPLYYDFPPMPQGGHPGVAFQWLELTGPIDSGQWPPESHRVLFDELPIRPAQTGTLPVELISAQPEKDAIRLLHRFLRRAQRQPLPDSVTAVYESLVREELQTGEPLAEALLSGYVAFLSSGHFLYLPEPVGPDTRTDPGLHYAIASRLSHFLAGARPDSTLMERAKRGEMLQREVLQAETDRLMEAESFTGFVAELTDYWLALKDIRKDEPDARLYPEYRFDDYLIDSMKRETRTFVTAMMRDNAPVTDLIDTDYAFINDRLAVHYGLPPVEGSRIRRIKLPASSPFGGLLTQAAIMKVTANGTTTSPVVRGAWILDRILGDPPPPPPAGVPAVEPDVRGTVTIREQLARHTSDASCSGCHARFDPIGFSLENFDIMGAWRVRYRSLSSGEKVTGIDRAGHDYVYHVAAPVDSYGQLADGTRFEGIGDLKKHLVSHPRQLARSLLHQLVVFSTGTPLRFSDRRVIEEILDASRRDGYRTRDLMNGLVQSRIVLGAGSVNSEPAVKGK